MRPLIGRGALSIQAQTMTLLFVSLVCPSNFGAESEFPSQASLARSLVMSDSGVQPVSLGSDGKESAPCRGPTESDKDPVRLSGKSTISGMCFSPDLQTVFTIAEKRDIASWNTRTGEKVSDVVDYGNVQACAVSGNGETLGAVASRDEKGLHIWGLGETKKLSIPPLYRNFRYNYAQIPAFSPGGRFLAFQYPYLDSRRIKAPATSVRLWDVDSGTRLLSIEPFPNGFSSFSITPDGKRLAGSSYNGYIFVWDTGTKAQLHRFRLDEDKRALVGLSVDGKMLASAQGAHVQVWELGSEKRIADYDIIAGEIVGIGIHQQCLSFGDNEGRVWVKRLDDHEA